MDKLTLRSSFIATLFGQKIQAIELSNKGLDLKSKEGLQHLTWDQLLNAPECHAGLFFNTLLIDVEGKTERIGWLPKAETVAFRQRAFQQYYAFHSVRVTQAAHKIDAQLSKLNYLRSSHIDQISRFASNAVKKARLPDKRLYAALPDELVALYEKLNNWIEKNPTFIDALRSKYVSEQILKYKAVFDRIESNPLTEKQRLACVIDEDNNLVLAGAGTGKTSTMIGRTAYLLESQQAKGHEILLLAYGNKAAEEMRERIKDKLNASTIDVFTFHALGQKIIAHVEGEKPSISPLATDEQSFKYHVNQWFQELLNVSSYKELVLHYFEQYLFPEANPFEFSTPGEYYEYIRANEIRTLQGEQVKSFEECLIANWLYAMGVEYCYESAYLAANTKTQDFRQYKPDFYLPEYDIYIEHFGINRKGETAPYVDNETYWNGITWKRDLHESHLTTLVETYHYEQSEGNLLANLEAKIAEKGVKFNPKPANTMLDKLTEFGAIARFAALLSDFLRQYKNSSLSLEQLKQSAKKPQLAAAATLLEPIISRYENYLIERNEIDFEDMINKAIAYVNDGRFKSPWKFILVDEFQDISFSRATLVKGLRDCEKNTSVFCVGDDWQAIYRFTGSDVSLTTHFDAIFGPTKKTSLDKTFRFNNKIGDLASKFVMQNPAQVKKVIHSHTQVDQPAVSLMRKSINNDDYFGHVIAVLAKIAEVAQPQSTVYILARYHFKLFEPAELRQIKLLHPTLDIAQLTFHASKGKEADFVILLGLDNGKNGFPSKKLTHPLIEALLPKAEDYPEAEERRLFYVAITRAKHRCYLIADMTRASPFVKELLKGQYELALSEFDVDDGQLNAKGRQCTVCKSGTLVKREGAHGAFMGCNNYPYCDNTERTCPRCSSPMNNAGEYRICAKPTCRWWMPICPDCNGSLLLRESKYGQFWGCENYRNGCTHKQKYIEGPSIENPA